MVFFPYRYLLARHGLKRRSMKMNFMKVKKMKETRLALRQGCTDQTEGVAVKKSSDCVANQSPKLLRLSAVIEIVGMKKSSIYAAIKRGEFPKPVKVFKTGIAVAWRSGQIEDFVSSRVSVQ